ncbi:hypothetical protein [Candidatus Tisiphia endosymbiont of Nemotelus uliginosus]|uniref:hypothetical protein n=1 Tax=Candidatus Tisiphia endosymbiont of Nemotelus uliginosus TaxID=3077926 RepID=UPI0035C928D3
MDFTKYHEGAKLIIKDIALDVQAIHKLLEYLRHHREVITLTLWESDIGYTGVQALVDSQYLTNLISLDL